MKKMMKMILASAVLVALSAGSVLAANDNVSVSVGVKSWYNSWKEGGFKSDTSAIMVGPSLKVGFDRFFVGASYLMSAQDYEFNMSPTFNADRKDLDLLAGFMIIPRFGLFAGYKTIDSKFTAPSVPGFSYDIKFKGPAVGATTNLQFDNMPVSLYASGAYLMLKESDSSGTGDTDYTGYTVDGGLTYTFAEKLSVGLGYKYQSLKPKNSSTKDNFSGATLSLDYRF